MKRLFFLFFLFINFGMQAQNPCEWSTDVTDSIGTYKSTKDYLVYERNFSSSSYVFFSLVLTDGMPTLNVQFIQKSKDFIKANCLNKNSKIYFQLDNGKVVTLLHIDKDICGTSVRDINGNDNLIMTGYFMFMKDSYKDLLSSPVSMMRIKYTSENVDYIFQSEFVSEMDKNKYQPSKYFMTSLPCIIN